MLGDNAIMRFIRCEKGDGMFSWIAMKHVVLAIGGGIGGGLRAMVLGQRGVEAAITILASALTLVIFGPLALRLVQWYLGLEGTEVAIAVGGALGLGGLSVATAVVRIWQDPIAVVDWLNGVGRSVVEAIRMRGRSK